MEPLKVLRSDLHLDSFAFTMETGFKGNSTGSKDLKRDKLGKYLQQFTWEPVQRLWLLVGVET